MRHIAMRRRDNADRGLTLIEVVVAVLVLSIAIVAAFRTFEVVTQHAGQATQRLLAQQVALNDLAEIHVAGLQGLGDQPPMVTMGPHRFGISRALEQTQAGYVVVRVQARSEGGIAASATGYFTVSEADP